MSPAELEVSFEQFWIVYPRKKAKVAAWRAWRKLKPNSAQMPAIVTGVMRYIRSGEWNDPQFIPYPATFLNQRRWEDWIYVETKTLEVKAVGTRYCGVCGHTGSWHLNETKHGRAPDHEFSEQVAV